MMWLDLLERILDFWSWKYDCDSWYVQVMMLFDLVFNGSSSPSDIN
jgi:hypothetical protein